MSQKESDNFLFIVEYFDPLPQIKKKYLLKYFVDSHSVEMIDIQKKKLFLKKSPCPPEVSASDFFIGGRVFLYSRELVIVEYGDGSTRRRLHKANTKCMAVVSSDVYQDWGVIISALENIPIRQDLAMTGSLSVRGEVLPIGGVTAKIESAAKSGIKTVVIPRANAQDVLLDQQFEDIEVIAVDTLDEVMEHALLIGEMKTSLVERLSAVIDRLTPEVSPNSQLS